MAQIKKITVSLTEDITLAEGYQFAWVKNTGSETLYISGDHSVLNAEGQIFDKDVATIKAGEATMVTIPHGILYCYSESSTTAEVHAQGIPTCPFKLAQKGGGGSGITVESLTVTENDTYTAPSGKAYSPVVVDVEADVSPITIRHNGIYVAQAEGLDGYSRVEVDVEVQPPLPSDYESLECIICPNPSDGATGFTMSNFLNPNNIIEAVSAVASTSSEYDLCGVYAFGTIYFASGKVQTYSEFSDLIGTRNVTVDTPVMARAKVASSGIQDGDFNICFYGYNQGYAYPFYGRVYSLKVYGNSNDVTKSLIDISDMRCWLVPAKRKSDNKIGMYDLIGDTFYPSTTGREFEAPIKG